MADAKTELVAAEYVKRIDGVAEAAAKRVKLKLEQLYSEDDEIQLLKVLYALRVTPMAQQSSPACLMLV